MDIDSTVEKYIKKIYSGKSGFGLKEDDVKKSQNVFTTYGEMLPESLTKLVNYLNMNDNDVVYDLGSGIGKVINQVFLQRPVKKAVGVEIVKSRNEKAIDIKNKLKEKFNDTKFKNQELDFIRGDMLEQDLSDSTIIYICSTCFSDEFLTRLVREKFNTSPNLRAVVTLKKLPINPNGLNRIEVIDTPCTWSRGVKSYVYTKN